MRPSLIVGLSIQIHESLLFHTSVFSRRVTVRVCNPLVFQALLRCFASVGCMWCPGHRCRSCPGRQSMSRPGLRRAFCLGDCGPPRVQTRQRAPPSKLFHTNFQQSLVACTNGTAKVAPTVAPAAQQRSALSWLRPQHVRFEEFL